MYSKEEVLYAIKGTHHVNIYSEDLPKQIISDSRLSDVLAELKRENEESYKEPLPHETFSLFRIYGERGSRKEFLDVYNKYRRKLMLNTISAYIYGEEHDICGAQDALWLILNEYSWTPPCHITAFDGTNKSNVSLVQDVADDNYIIDNNGLQKLK